MKLAAVILAAGQSLRFGRNKQLECFEDLPLVRHAARAIAAVEPHIFAIVLGCDAARVASAAGVPFLIVNERHAEGIGSSLAAAVRALGDRADALLIGLGDQPLVPASHYRDLVASSYARDDAIVASRYAGTLGAPALFGKRYFPELAALSGDRGAKALLDRHAARVIELPCREAEIDVDTKDDYDELLKNADGNLSQNRF